MILPLVHSEKTETDHAAVLERKMIRIRALYDELNRILDAEYVAGMACDPKTLNKLILRKRNFIHRFENLVRAMGAQLGMMLDRGMPSAMPITLINQVKMIPGLTPAQEAVLFPLAKNLEQRHLRLMTAAAAMVRP